MAETKKVDKSSSTDNTTETGGGQGVGGYAGLIVAGISDFANGMMYLANRSDSIEAQKESRKLYDIERRDKLNQRKNNLTLLKKNSNLRESDLSFQEDFFKKQQGDDLSKLADTKKETAGNLFRTKAQNLFNTGAEANILFKQSQKNRY